MLCEIVIVINAILVSVDQASKGHCDVEHS